MSQEEISELEIAILNFVKEIKPDEEHRLEDIREVLNQVDFHRIVKELNETLSDEDSEEFITNYCLETMEGYLDDVSQKEFDYLNAVLAIAALCSKAIKEEGTVDE